MAWVLETDGVNDLLTYSPFVASGDFILSGFFDRSNLTEIFLGEAGAPNYLANLAGGNIRFRIANTIKDISGVTTTGKIAYSITRTSGVISYDFDGVTGSFANTGTLNLTQFASGAGGFYYTGRIYDDTIFNNLSGDSRNYSPTASSHAAGTVILVDTIGANNATGVNMPTDGSAWVDLGGGGLTLVADVNIDTPVFSVSSTVTQPATTSNISFDLAKPVFNVSTTVTSPSYSSDASIEMQSPVFNSSATVTLPQPLSGFDLTINAPLFSASVDVTLPSSISNIDLNITKPIFNSSATVTLPQPDLTASISISKPEFSASVTVTDQALNSNINISINSPVFSVGSSVTLPQPLSDIQFNVLSPVFSVSSTVSGLDIIVGSNAKITVLYSSNTLVLQANSNSIKV